MKSTENSTMKYAPKNYHLLTGIVSESDIKINTNARIDKKAFASVE